MVRFFSSFFLFFILIHPSLRAEDFLLEGNIPHECGVAMVRLRKPISYYAEHYGEAAWGAKKLLLLMEKQRNRGQDGAGIAVVKLGMPLGQEYMQQLRVAENSIDNINEIVTKDLQQLKTVAHEESEWKRHSSYVGEVMLGHLRYATHSGTQIKFCQPFIRSHHVACRHFALAGNFNMTNTAELFNQLEDLGLCPTSESDTAAILDLIAYQLDKEYDWVSFELTNIEGKDRTEVISKKMDLTKVIREAAKNWDGGYVFCSILGNGDAFVCRDPAGIRPGYYYIDDEVVAAASEKAALMEAFDLQEKDVLALKPGHILVIKRSGEVIESSFTNPLPERQCVFERVYFSKANDPQIYTERKALGRQLASKVFHALDGDISHTIFTYVPNSSLLAFQGLVEEITQLSKQKALSNIKEKMDKGILDLSEIQKLTHVQARAEYLIAKNQKVRTFISSDLIRKNLVPQLYEITQGVVTSEDTLVVIDDSIVRGVTLKESLISKLIKLNPKRIIIVSSAPPVFYPDCYGIDMSQLGRFVAFQAAVSLLKERGQEELLTDVNALCFKQRNLSGKEMQNAVKKIYGQFTLEEISAKIAQLITPANTEWKGSIEVIYQSLEGLREAIPNFTGDWYFSGDYPTPGGLKVLNTSYLKWSAGNDSRSY